MTKDEAMKALGVSKKTLERMVQKGELTVKYESGKTRSVATFSPEQVHGLAAKRGIIEGEAVSDDAMFETAKQMGLVRVKSNSDKIASKNASNKNGVAIPDAIQNQFLKSLERVGLGNVILYTIKDMVLLSNLSEDFIRKAIHAKKLKAKIIGKSYKAKREDFELFVKKL